MNIDELKKHCLQLMATTNAVYLTTINPEGFPETRAMLNLRNAAQYPGLVPLFAEHPEDFRVYLTTNTASEKMAHIRANSAASLYYCNPANFHGLMLSGRIEIITAAHLKNSIWQKGWEMYYPGGVEDPDYSILALSPQIAKGWYVMEKFKFEIKGKE